MGDGHAIPHKAEARVPLWIQFMCFGFNPVKHSYRVDFVYFNFDICTPYKLSRACYSAGSEVMS